MAEVNPAEISAILKKQLKDFDSTSSLDEIGSVLTVGDGIARAYGLSNAQYGELVEFSNGTQGIVLNLEKDGNSKSIVKLKFLAKFQYSSMALPPFAVWYLGK